MSQAIVKVRAEVALYRCIRAVERVGQSKLRQRPTPLLPCDVCLRHGKRLLVRQLPRNRRILIRGGYGINYNTGQYATIARQLANQQPFAVTQTNIAGQQGCGTLTQFTLANAFNCSNAAVQSNFSANLNYRLGHVQIWDLDIQKTLPMGIVANVGYNGAKGGNLDMVRAPNRTASGLLNSNAQPFD